MYVYKEIKEIRTQLSIAAYLFASPKQHVDPPLSPFRATTTPHPPPLCPAPASAIPSADVCLTVGSWVIFYANCKLSVKIVVIGLIQQCQPKCLRAGQRGGREHRKKTEKKLQKQHKISRAGNSKY